MEISTIPADTNELEARKRQRKQEQIRRQKISQLNNNYEDEQLCLGKEYQDAWGKNQEDIALEQTTLEYVVEVSSIPTDPSEWERRMKIREEDRIKRRAVSPPTDYEDILLYFGEEYKRKFNKLSKKGCKDIRERYPGFVLANSHTSKHRTYKQYPTSVTPIGQINNENINTENLRFDMASTAEEQLCLGKEYQDAWGKNQEDIALEQKTLGYVVEASSIPTDPSEWERRIKMREEERIKRRAVSPPTEYEDLLYFGEEYKREFNKLSKKGCKDIRERYPGITLANLHTSKHRTYKQYPTSVTPINQINNKSINTENLRFGMASSVVSPAHRPLELEEPTPDFIRPENPARIRVRTVQEVNALPGELFVHLVTTGGADIATNRLTLSE